MASKRSTKSNEKRAFVDYTALLAKAKEMNAKVQEAKDYACYVSMTHRPFKTCDAANAKFHLLEKEYKLWKKINIDKRGLVLKTLGDKDEPIGILAVLAGAWDAPLECIANRWVVAKA